MTDFRALCTELVEAWDSYSYADAGDAADRMAEAVKAARAALAQPAPPAEGEVGEPVAVGQPTDAQLLELYPLSMINLDDAFAFARAVLSRWGSPATPPAPEPPAGALAARPLLEKVARLGDVIGQQTVAQVQQLAEQAAVWLRDNPPGQPVAIEPRGCPTPGACTCVEPALPLSTGEVQE